MQAKWLVKTLQRFLSIRKHNINPFLFVSSSLTHFTLQFHTDAVLHCFLKQFLCSVWWSKSRSVGSPLSKKKSRTLPIGFFCKEILCVPDSGLLWNSPICIQTDAIASPKPQTRQRAQYKIWTNTNFPLFARWACFCCKRCRLQVFKDRSRDLEAVFFEFG